MSVARRVVELLIQGKDLSGRAVGSAAAGLRRLQGVGKTVFANLRAASDNALRGFQERAGHRMFDGALSAVQNFLSGSIFAAGQVEEGNNKLRQSVEAIGLDYDKLTGQVEAAAAQIMDVSFFDDDEAKAGLAAMIEQTNDYRFSIDNLNLVADIAYKRGISMADAGEIVGKAYRGNTKSLKELGIYTRDAGRAMDELHRKFDGAARGGLENANGQIRAAQRDLGELQEEISTMVAPAVAYFTGLLRMLTKFVRENREAILKWVAGMAALFIIGQVTGMVIGLTGAARTLATTLGVSLLRVVMVGGPLIIGLTAISALFIKNRIDALNAEAAVERYRQALRRLSAEKLMEEGLNAALSLAAAEGRKKEMQTDGTYSRPARRSRVPRNTTAGMFFEESVESGVARMGGDVVTAAGAAADAQIAAAQFRVDQVREVLAETKALQEEIEAGSNQPLPCAICGEMIKPADMAAHLRTHDDPARDRKQKQQDPERERIDALRQAATLGVLTNAERAEAVRLETAINARLAAGIADTEKRVDSAEKLRDLEELRRADFEKELTLLGRANTLQAATPAMLERARASQAHINAQLAAGNLTAERRLDLLDLAKRYHDALNAPIEAQIALLEQANGVHAMTAARVAAARGLVEQLNQSIGNGGMAEADRLATLEQIGRLYATIRAPMEEELARLDAIAGRRALSADEMTRLVNLSADLNVLQAEAVGHAGEQAALTALQERIQALVTGNQEKEVERLTQARALRRLTPDETGRVALLRAQLEKQIEINLGTAEELRLRQQLAQLAPDSGGMTRGEMNQGSPEWLRTIGLTTDGISRGMREALGPIQALDKAVGQSLVGSFERMGEAAGMAMGTLLRDGRLSWKGFADVGKAALADLAATHAKYFFAQGTAELAKGIGTGSPAAFASAAKWFAAGVLMSGVSHAISSSGGGGGGSGSGRESSQGSADRLSGSVRGRAEVHFHGRGWIDTSDPHAQDAFEEVFNNLVDRDRVDVHWN